MAQTVVIDIEARFIDNTSGVGAASRKLDQFSRTIERTQKTIDRLNGKKVNPMVDANDNVFLRKMSKVRSWLERHGHTKAVATLDAMDSATRKILNVVQRARAFVRERFIANIQMRAISAFQTMQRVKSLLFGLVGKAWRITIGIADKVTAPLRNIMGQFKGILALAGLAGTFGTVRSAVSNEITQQNLEAQYATMFSNSPKELKKVGVSGNQFKNMSREDRMAKGYEAAEKRVQELIDFAGETPYTRQEIFQADKILQTYTGGKLNNKTDRKLVGNLAAIGGRDYESVATMMGRLYVNMKGGHGIGDTTMYLREMGVLSSENEERISTLADKVKSGAMTMKEAWKGVRNEFKDYDGMMLEMSKKLGNLLTGIKAQITNNVLAPIGEGISDTLSPFLTRFKEWRGTKQGKEMIGGFRDSLKGMAQSLGSGILDKVERLAKFLPKIKDTWDALSKTYPNMSAFQKIGDIISFDIMRNLGDDGKIGKFFQLAGKGLGFLSDSVQRMVRIWKTWGEWAPDMSMIERFRRTIDTGLLKPLTKWWTKDGGKEMFTSGASKFGKFIGEAGSGLLKGLFGIEDKNGMMSGAADVAEEIGKSFMDGFKKGFDIEGVLSGLWKQVKEHPLMSTVLGGTILHKITGGTGLLGLPAPTVAPSGGGIFSEGPVGTVVDGIDTFNSAYDTYDNVFGSGRDERRERRRRRKEARAARKAGRSGAKGGTSEAWTKAGGRLNGQRSGKWMSRLGKLGKIGAVGALLSLAGLGIYGATKAGESKKTGAKFFDKDMMGEIGDVFGGLGGGAAGSAVGAGIGAMFGGVGAIPGALIGGIAGSFGGGAFGKAIMTSGGRSSRWSGHGRGGKTRGKPQRVTQDVIVEPREKVKKPKTKKIEGKIKKEIKKKKPKVKQDIEVKGEVKQVNIGKGKQTVEKKAKEALGGKTTTTADTTTKINNKLTKGSKSSFDVRSWAKQGLPTSITHHVKVNIVREKGTTSGYSGPGKEFRGGFHGAGIPHYAEGGLVRGGAQLSILAEEGTPEAVIPLGRHRRQRGIDLWKKAGEYLGIQKYGQGGFVGGVGGSVSNGSGGMSVNVGGITINVQGSVDEISENKMSIAQEVAEILNTAISSAYENMPASA